MKPDSENDAARPPPAPIAIPAVLVAKHDGAWHSSIPREEPSDEILTANFAALEAMPGTVVRFGSALEKRCTVYVGDADALVGFVTYDDVAGVMEPRRGSYEGRPTVIGYSTRRTPP